MCDDLDGKAQEAIALATLVGHAGGSDLEIGWDCPHTEDLPDDTDHNCPGVRWYAMAMWRGGRFMVDNKLSLQDACIMLASKILHNAECRCGLRVTMREGEPGCYWRAVDGEWKSSCTAPTVAVDYSGDKPVVRRNRNREERREQERRRRRRKLN